MHRYIRGLMLAAAAGVVWGCGDDPLAEGAGDNLQLVGDPAAVFVGANELERMVVELKDGQGTSVQTEFAVSNVSAGISVEVDETFVPVFSPDGELLPPTSPTRVRLEVTAGNTPGVESFDVTASGVTKTFTVRVLPAEVAATFSSLTPAAGDQVTVTADGWRFLASTGVDIGGVPAANVAVGVDGSSLTFVPRPGSAGVVTFTGIELAVAGLPSLVLNLAAPDEITTGSAVAAALPGTDDPLTAPAFDLPTEVGLATVVTDQLNVVDQFYNFDVMADGTYDVELWMEKGDGCIADLDLFTSAGNSATCSHPEHVEASGLTAGALLETLVEYYGGAVPVWIQLIVRKTS